MSSECVTRQETTVLYLVLTFVMGGRRNAKAPGGSPPTLPMYSWLTGGKFTTVKPGDDPNLDC